MLPLILLACNAGWLLGHRWGLKGSARNAHNLGQSMTDRNDLRGPALGWPLGPVAHRGLHDPAKGRIENTASAFEAAIAMGYAIECDVQAAAGDQPVVFHDETLDRLMEASGPVAERKVPELTRLAYRSTSDRILTLDELLELVGGRVPLYIEVKSNFGKPGRYEAEICNRLRDYRGPAALMSFDPGSLTEIRRLAPATPRGIISYRWADDWMPQIAAEERKKLRNMIHHVDVAPSFIAYDIDELPDPVPLVMRTMLGIPLFTWTVRTPEQRTRAKLYADAIIFEGFEA